MLIHRASAENKHLIIAGVIVSLCNNLVAGDNATSWCKQLV
jgi:hypothetical protein